jgi:hypothetical protein
VHRQVVTDVKYFYSVAEAIAYSATLRDTLRDYKATQGAGLLNAMHRAAPGMVRRRVTFRHHLAEDEEAKRPGWLTCWYGCTMTPSLLNRTVFTDETTIQTHGLKHDHIEVWVNSSDTRFHDFHGVPGKAWDPVKVHVIAAVTAHPHYDALGGLVYVEFTTGTTNINGG